MSHKLTSGARAASTGLRDAVTLAAEILDLRSWRAEDAWALILLAGFLAVVAQPLVYGSLGSTIVALMTPVR